MKIDKPPELDENQEGFPASHLRDLNDWLNILHEKLYEDDIAASIAWNPGSIANGGIEVKEVTVTGAALGDYVHASFSLDLQDITMGGWVTAANNVTCIMANATGGAIDLGSGTLYVRVLRRTT
ncbi:MAG: hypothetical protein ACYS1A_18390 [Planctomycetota bacterium]|jgi:hypothetical protein